MGNARHGAAREAIAIVGIGCRFPGGAHDAESFWGLVARGIDAVGEVPESRWNVSEYYNPVRIPGKTYSKWGGFVADIDRFEPEAFGISPREAAQMDPQQRMLLEVSWEALEDAGLPVTEIAGTNTGVFVGISTADYSNLRVDGVDGYAATGGAASIAANRISYWLNASGPSIVVDTACSSALVAVHLACQSIWNGECDLALAGGANAILSPNAYIAFCAANMLSPEGHCKAFDAGADGFVRAEGAGIVVLRRLSRALEEGNPVHATIAATGVNQDGRTSGIALPSQTAQETLLRSVCAQAGIPPKDVDYVEAHGTGTPVGDPIEARSLGRVLSPERTAGADCLIGSVKTNLGHLESAAGIAGLIKAALALRHRRVPPSLHFKEPNPNIPFAELKLRVPTTLEEWPQQTRPATAAVNAFGFGGTNANALLIEYREKPGESRDEALEDAAGPWLLPLSAASPEALERVAEAYRALSSGNGTAAAPAVRDVCYSAGTGRAHFEHRLAVVVQSHEELAAQLDAYLRGEGRPGMSSGGGIAGPRAAKVAFVFSGQGPQWWGMGRELLAREPVFRNTLAECDALLSRYGDWSLLAELSRDEHTSRIQETAIAQPALFALQAGLLALWHSWGVEPQAVIGHSVGEVAAAYAAGALSLDDAVKVIFHRGCCMDTASSRGRMLAVGLPQEAAQAECRGIEDRVSLAAVNGPSDSALSGDPEALDEIARSLESRGIFCRFLQVHYAFHSPQMEPVRAALLAALAGLEATPARVPMVSTVTGTLLVGPELGADYWWQNVRQTVRFTAGVEQLLENGCDTFIELSPHPVLAGSIREIVRGTHPERIGHVLPSLRRREAERAQLLSSLGGLYAAGFQVDWRRVWPRGGARVELPKYPWKRERYWRETEAEQSERLSSYRHPLLGKRQSSAHPLWQAEIDKRAIPYLADHRVQGRAVFPGTGYLEMAAAAGGELFGDGMLAIEKVQFLQALFLPDSETAPAAQFVYAADDASFEIRSRSRREDPDWVLHAIGCLRNLENPHPGSVLDLEQVQARLEEASVEECYRRFTEAGLDYGAMFRVVTQLYRRDGEALGRIELSAACSAERGRYRFHPALLDGCLQVLLGAVPQDDAALAGTLYLPVYVERVRFYSSPGSSVSSHVRLERCNENGLVGDIRVVDAQGRLLIALEGLRCRSVAGMTVRETPSDWLFETRWYEKPLSAAAPGISRLLPSTREVARAAEEELAGAQTRLGCPEMLSRGHAALNQVAAELIWQALCDLGAPCEPGQRVSLGAFIDERRVSRSHERLMRRFMEILERAHYVAGAGRDEWRVLNAIPARGPRESWREALARNPAYLTELMLVDRIGSRLGEALRGVVDPVALLFEGSMDAAERFYTSSATSLFFNIGLQACLGRVLEDLPEGRRIRILEVGAGTGGATSHLLPLLPPRRTQYVFTDAGSVFLAKAEDRYRGYPFVECQLFDIEKDPSSQGFAARSFDLIVASQVLHATADLRRTLSGLSALLAPGGLLMFLEPDKASAWVDLVFGLMDGWWRFTDFERRPDHALMEGPAWAQVLRQTGFEDVVHIPVNAATEIPASILLGRAPLGETPDIETAEPGPHAVEWLIFADRSGVGAELAELLSRRGDRPLLIEPGAAFRRVDARRYEISPSSVADVDRLCTEVATAPELRGIVHLWSLDAAPAEEATNAALETAERLGCHAVMHIVQALERRELWGGSERRLIAVTRSAQPLGDKAAMAVLQAPLLGLGRVIFNEYPNIRLKLVDLGPAVDPAGDARSLLFELDTEDPDREVALRQGTRFVPRAQRFEARALPVARTETGRFQLTIPRPGAFDRLTAVAIESPRMGPGEVEIEVVAAALNFRDVMKVLGLYPTDSPDAAILGDECSGRITRVGEGVSGLEAGDEVIAIAPGSFASTVVTRAHLVTKKPEALSFAEAATTPVAFLTAYYGLVHLAHLSRGERVLVHAATGGVGLAAVELARSAGARIYGTAGSPEKRRFLEQVGVARVMDSRSLAFADEIMEETDGRGVDVVLNSLAGHAIERGIACLAPFGRFVELGKRDIYQNRKLGLWDFRKNLSYFAVDLGRLFEGDGTMIRPLLQECLQMLREERFHALPHAVFPISRSIDAFRVMAQAKHIGKLVLSLDDRNLRVTPKRAGETALRSGGTYLITGGFGGYGLTVAEWCIERGAGCVVLMSRSGAVSEEARDAVARLQGRGGRVVEAKADVASERAVREVIDRIDRELPPLRGVFHLAMVLDDGILLQLNPERFMKATAPKAAGAWNLHRATLKHDLDLFVAFSSVSSLFGSPGQANYAAGNAFLDALAHLRRARGLPATTINWGVLEGVGYVARHDVRNELLRANPGLAPAEAMAALDRILLENLAQVAALRANWSLLKKASPGNAAVFSDLVAENAESADPGEADTGIRAAIERAAEEEKLGLLETYLKGQLARVLGIAPERLDPNRPLTEVGLDSLMGVELKNRVENDLEIALPVGTLLQGPTLSEFAAKIAGHLGGGMAAASEPTQGIVRRQTPEELLAKVDQLSDEEVEQLLKENLEEGEPTDEQLG